MYVYMYIEGSAGKTRNVVFYSRKRKFTKLAWKDETFLSIAMDYQKHVNLLNISTNDVQATIKGNY